MSYECITRFAGALAEDPGTMSEMVKGKDVVLQPPHYIPSEAMRAFINAFYGSDIIDVHYIENLERAGINPGATDAATLDVSTMDAPLVIAILTKCVRAERFCEGALMDAARSGLLDRCLYRLAEIDDADEEEEDSYYASISTETKEVAAAILDFLKETMQGTEVTTGWLCSWLTREEPQLLDEETRRRLERIGREMDLELMDLDFAMHHDAALHGLVLDNSAYEHMIIGLPYNIPFTVRKLEN